MPEVFRGWPASAIPLHPRLPSVQPDGGTPESPTRPSRCTVRDDLPMRARLLYDRDCGFCRWCLGKVLAWDRRRSIRPVAIHTPEAERLLAGMASDARMSSWHLVDRNGEVHSAGAGFPPFLRLLPVGVPFASFTAR